VTYHYFTRTELTKQYTKCTAKLKHTKNMKSKQCHKTKLIHTCHISRKKIPMVNFVLHGYSTGT